jgi:ankyrin repeat protein
LINGASLEYRDNGGETALHAAVRFNDNSTSMVRMLLAHGADVNSRDGSSHTPLMTSVSYGSRCIESLLILLENGAYIDARDDCDRTTLFRRASYVPDNKAKYVLKVLIDHGASTSIFNVIDDHKVSQIAPQVLDYISELSRARKEFIWQCLSKYVHFEENLIWIILSY